MTFSQNLASFSCRELPWTTVATCTAEGRKYGMRKGGRRAKCLNGYLAKLGVCSSVYPSFSFRQLPSAFVNFRGLPAPHILRNTDNTVCVRGPEAEVLEPILNFSLMFSLIIASLSFRQIP